MSNSDGDFNEDFDLTRHQILRLIDPYDKNPLLTLKTNEELSKILFNICMEYYSYKISDYDLSREYVVGNLIRKEKELKKKEQELRRREREMEREMEKGREMENRKIDNDYVREPIPVKRECLLPPISSFEQQFQNARYYSEIEENSRYRDEMEKKRKEEEEFNLALKLSLQEQEEKILRNSKIDCPNYEKLLNKTSEFNNVIADRLYHLLKDKKFDEFKEALNDVPLQVSSCIWKLTDSEGSTLKQLFLRKGDAYKCLE